jgi:hypothetical protein
MQKRGPPSAETDDSDRRQLGQVVTMLRRATVGESKGHYPQPGPNLKLRSGYNVRLLRRGVR